MVVEKPAEKKGIDFYFGKRNKREQWLTAALQKRKYKGPFLQKKKKRKVWLYITWYALCLLANTLAYIEAAHPGQLVTHTKQYTRREQATRCTHTFSLFYFPVLCSYLCPPPSNISLPTPPTPTHTIPIHFLFCFVLFEFKCKAHLRIPFEKNKTKEFDNKKRNDLKKWKEGVE